jgi:hypothetical protein
MLTYKASLTRAFLNALVLAFMSGFIGVWLLFF